MKRMIAVTLVVVAVLAGGLLPGQVYAYWRTHSGYVLPGVPVMVYVNGLQTSAQIVNSLDTGRNTLVVDLAIH